MTKIILKGYYGFGNLGDDILMLTTYKIVRDIFPQAEIWISSESKNPEYIHKFLPDVKITNSSQDIEVDWVIHGGGGVFFDFKEHSIIYEIINWCIKAIGYRAYSKVYDFYQRLKGNKHTKLKARAGLGIGVGTYTRSSNRFYSDILSLSNFNILLVRDDPSVTNAQQYCNSINIHKATDLAFLADHWMPGDISVSAKKESIGFILRDWTFNNHVSVLVLVAKKLHSQGHEVKFFSFDEISDSQFIKSVSSFGSTYCWRPNEIKLDCFLSELMTCQLVISSRAHGAIISTCLGIPVLCVCIEPKLTQVAAMLKDSARTIVEPFDQDKIYSYILETLNELPSLKEGTHGDVARNRQEMLNGVSLFRSFISNYRVPQ